MPGHADTIRHLYAAFSHGDVPGVLAALAPDVRWTEAEGFPYGGTYIGRDAVLQHVFMKLGSEWDGYAAVPHELVTDGVPVVALGQYSGTFKATGKSFRAPFAHVWKFSGDLVGAFVQHTDTAIVQRVLR